MEATVCEMQSFFISSVRWTTYPILTILLYCHRKAVSQPSVSWLCSCRRNLIYWSNYNLATITKSNLHACSCKKSSGEENCRVMTEKEISIKSDRRTSMLCLQDHSQALFKLLMQISAAGLCLGIIYISDKKTVPNFKLIIEVYN